MKECKQCLSRWDSKYQVTVCPFCHAELKEEDPAKMATVPQVIAYLIREKGQDFVGAGSFAGYFSDVAPQFATESRLIRIAVESGAYGALLKATDRPYVIGIEKQKLCQNYFMGEQWAERVLQWLAEALEGKSIPMAPVPPVGKSAVPPEQSPFQIRGTILLSYTGTEEHVVIPDGVTNISSVAFWTNKHIRSVTLPDSVIKIHNEAFRGCTSLESIHLGNSLEYIGAKAFQDCTALKELHMPKTVTQMENYAFAGCTSLVEVWLSPSLKTHHLGVFYNCTKLKKFSYTD